MITNIWLKSQPKKKISYPDCLPKIYYSMPYKDGYIDIIDDKDNTHACFKLEVISRIEFRPS